MIHFPGDKFDSRFPAPHCVAIAEGQFSTANGVPQNSKNTSQLHGLPIHACLREEWFSKSLVNPNHKKDLHYLHMITNLYFSLLPLECSITISALQKHDQMETHQYKLLSNNVEVPIISLLPCI